MVRVSHLNFIPQKDDNEKEFLGTNVKKIESLDIFVLWIDKLKFIKKKEQPST